MSELNLSTSLWLEVSHGERSWLFELTAGDDRAIVVGSDVNADVLVVRPGVGSTHFHFERDGAAVLLVPGYRAALRVNSVRTLEPVALPGHATVELLNLSLKVVTHTEKPEHLRITERPPSPSRLAPRDYFENLPDETEPTGFTLAPASAAAYRLDYDTVEAPRPTFDTEPLPRVAFEPDGTLALDLPATPAASIAPYGLRPAALGPQGTVMLAVPNLDEDPPARAAVATRSSPAPENAPLARTITERLPVPQLGAAPRDVDSVPPVAVLRPHVVKTAQFEVPQAVLRGSTPVATETTRVEVPAPRRFGASPPAHDLRIPEAPSVHAAPRAAMEAPDVSPAAPMATAAVSRAPLPASSSAPLAAQRTADFDVSAVASLLMTPPSGSLPRSPASERAPQAPAAGARGYLPSTALVTSSPTQRAPVAPVAGPTQRARAMSYLTLLGNEAMRRPVAVGATATAVAALVALALVGASRFATHPLASSAAVSVAGTPAQSPAQSVLTGSAIAVASAASALAATPPSPPPEGQTPTAQEVGVAVQHLLAGRRQEADSAYRQLSAADPSNPAYAAISRMLAERAAARCSATPTPSGCPEVLP